MNLSRFDQTGITSKTQFLEWIPTL